MAAAPTCIAIDWSGDATDAGQRRKIVAATVRDGLVTDVSSGRTRAEVARWLNVRPTGATTFIGFDFSFSVPHWFARSLGCGSVDAVWALVAERGERWLRECAPPFWGRPATRCRLETPDRYRACEQRLRARHRQPKSVFQIGGAGAVGTGSVRGMPWLAWLRARGLAIWPFDGIGACTAFEVYPALFAAVAKHDSAGRAAHLDRLPSTVLGGRDREAAIASDDAFDAVVSALAMWERRDELASLKAATDRIAAIEGDIWI
ncbi:MAG: hypothetical protein QOH10_2238 [Actinomycetota bacterium]|nr:hypothetical protein [Actinomycetota bacterium]